MKQIHSGCHSDGSFPVSSAMASRLVPSLEASPMTPQHLSAPFCSHHVCLTGITVSPPFSVHKHRSFPSFSSSLPLQHPSLPPKSPIFPRTVCTHKDTPQGHDVSNPQSDLGRYPGLCSPGIIATKIVISHLKAGRTAMVFEPGFLHSRDLGPSLQNPGIKPTGQGESKALHLE